MAAIAVPRVAIDVIVSGTFESVFCPTFVRIPLVIAMDKSAEPYPFVNFTERFVPGSETTVAVDTHSIFCDTNKYGVGS